MEEAIEFVLRRLKYDYIFFFLKKMVQFGTIWCFLGPILASITLLFLRLFFFKCCLCKITKTQYAAPIEYFRMKAKKLMVSDTFTDQFY